MQAMNTFKQRENDWKGHHRWITHVQVVMSIQMRLTNSGAEYMTSLPTDAAEINVDVPSKGSCSGPKQFLRTGSSLKLMNVFLSHLKSFFSFLRYIHLCPEFLFM